MSRKLNVNVVLLLIYKMKSGLEEGEEKVLETRCRSARWF
jgi:hypothetical protein